MKKLQSLIAIVAAVCCFTAAPALAVTTFTVTNVGTDAQNLQVHVTITEIAATLSTPGSIDVKLEVADGYFADLRGAFFHLSDESLLADILVTGIDVTNVVISQNGVNDAGNGANINGQVLNLYGNFDVGVQLGSSGMSPNDIAVTTFNVSHATLDITEDMLTGLAFGVRATSVGVTEDARGDSSKLGGLVPDPDDDNNTGGGQDPTPTPEPATAAMGLMALAGLAMASRRRHRA